MAEKTVTAFESGGSEASSGAPPTLGSHIVEHQTIDDQILVDIGNGDSDTGTCTSCLLYWLSIIVKSSTGLLVDIKESRGPTESPPHDKGPTVSPPHDKGPTVSPPPMEPAVARIISIDQTWPGDDDREDTALVSSQQPKSVEDPSSPSRQKPSRPAPPKPAIRRAKTVKEKPNLPPRPSDRSLSPPAGHTGEAQSLLIIDSRQKSKSVR